MKLLAVRESSDGEGNLRTSEGREFSEDVDLSSLDKSRTTPSQLMQR